MTRPTFACQVCFRRTPSDLGRPYADLCQTCGEDKHVNELPSLAEVHVHYVRDCRDTIAWQVALNAMRAGLELWHLLDVDALPDEAEVIEAVEDLLRSQP